MLAERILATLKYFDVQDHALTLIEIHKYLLVTPTGTQAGKDPDTYSLAEIWQCIGGQLQNSVAELQGFYFLAGRQELVQRRLQNNFYAAVRFKRVRKYLPLARHLPFIAAVALTGSEALSNSRQGSDIDLLVISKKNRLWLSRLSMAFFFQVLGLRRYGGHIENRFCLNHYVEAGKTLHSDQNLYTAVEYVSLVPFFGADIIADFQQRNSAWILRFLAQPQLADGQNKNASLLKRAIDSIFDNRVGDFFESMAGRLQLGRIKVQEYITVEHDELSFHPGSKGQQILSKSKASK